LFDPKRYPARVLILFLLLILPIIRLLLYHRYGFFYPEVFAAFLLVLGVSAVLAAIGRWPLLFHAEVVGLAVVLSFNAVQLDFAPTLQLRWIILCLLLLLIGALLILKSRFYPILAVFLFGSFAADIGKAAIQSINAAPRTSQASAGLHPNHVIHLVFDEMIGLGGLPEDCRSCVRARHMLEKVFTRGNFRMYSNAFSNYRSTQDSIPSIMNDRLLTRTGEHFPQTSARPYLRRNQEFSRHIQNGDAVRVYQSDYILYDTFPQVVARTYQLRSLRPLHQLPMSWLDRLGQIGIVYLQSDRSWWGILDRVFRSKPLPEALMVGPLSAQEVWPNRILADCRAANRNTLFFAHLMLPHYPVLYRPDGSVRNLEEWRHQGDKLDFYEGDAAEYRQRYEFYGEQVQFVARELETFFDGLRASGLYDSTTIIIHGDHGSRLRLLKEQDRKERERLRVRTDYCPAVSRYDYVRDPELRDLLNRYSTLLVVKPAGASVPETVTEKGSVLYFLRRASGAAIDPTEYKALNSVYLFNANGLPQAIPMLKFWEPNQEEKGLGE